MKLKILMLLAVFTAFPLLSADDSNKTQQERAVSALEQNVKNDPNNPELFVHLGFAYRKLNDMEKAKSAFEKAVALDPKNQESLFMLALIYENSKQNQEALRIWKQYLETNPEPSKKSVAETHIERLSK